MDLVRWTDDLLDPVRNLDRIQNEINRLFDVPRAGETRGLFDRTVSPALDLIETEDSYVVVMDLPGIKTDQMDISIASNILTIKGEKKLPEEKGRVLRRENWEGAFQRTLSLPTSVDAGKVEATYRDGILEIHVAKREEARPKRISVKAG